MVNLFIVAEVFAIGIIFVALELLLADESGAKEQKLMGYFLCGALIQNAGYLLEITSSSVEAAVVSVKVQYLGSIFVPLFYCLFIYSYCYKQPPKKFLGLIGIVDMAALILIFTQEKHSLYYRKMEWLETGEGHHYLSLTYGPAYVIVLLCYCVLPYFLAMLTLLKSIIGNREDAKNRKYKLILVLSSLPVLALLAYAGKLTQVFDLTPAVLGIVLSLVVILVWRRRTHDFRHMAATVVLGSMSDGVVAVDTQKRLISYNRAAVTIFPGLASYQPGDNLQDMQDFPQDMYAEDSNKKFSLNDRYYESHTKQILDKDGQMQGYAILFLDVTDTRNYIEEIKSVREQAERANTAKSEFLANMSHEIRTPMNAIIGLSDLIMEESAGRKMYNYAGDIKSASQNLLAIINDILDLSKVEAGKMELVPSDYHVKSAVSEVVHMMDIAASQRGLLMKHEYDMTIPSKYYGDVGRIKQILINLLNNAVKFTREGYVKISVGGRPGDAEDEELLVFRVEDTGCGIREEDREKIFENFKQVDSKRNRGAEGTGLGLSITKRLIELMNGTIELESVYGKGSTFTVTIPQKIVDRRTLEEAPDAPVVKEERMETFIAPAYPVLVVDDNLINRKVAISFLNTYKFQVDEAESGFGAIELVKNKKYEIIFMDHMMPEMDGIEAARLIREECGENGTHPVMIALTANAMEGVREMFLRNGFQDFLTKPLDRKRLNDTLLKWVPANCREVRDASADPADNIAFGDIRIKGIDQVAVIRHQSGSPASDYVELLRLYCMDGKRKLELLKELHAKKDYKSYEIEVHALKSASANVGAMELSGAAREHEMAAKEGNEAFIGEHFEQLIAAYGEQIRNIQEFLEEKDRENQNVEEKILDIDHETLAQEVGEALKQVSAFRSKECAAKVEALLRYRLDDKVQAQLKNVQEQLKLYEDGVAEDLLTQLLESLNQETDPTNFES